MGTAEAAMANLNDLAKVSKELNAKSNEVNKILQDLEKKLVAMNLGIEVWIPDSPLSSEKKTEEEENQDGDVIGSHRVSVDEVLGFDGRRLVHKTVYYREDPAINWQKTWQVEQELSSQPLLQASRDLRIEAMNHIEPLINALIEKGKRMIKGIEQGRNIVNNL